MVEERDTGKPDEITPYEIDLVPVVAAGTVLWTVALVVLLSLHTTLRAHHRGWWVEVAATGVGLGLLGLVVSLRFRRRQAAPGPRRPLTKS